MQLSSCRLPLPGPDSRALSRKRASNKVSTLPLSAVAFSVPAASGASGASGASSTSPSAVPTAVTAQHVGNWFEQHTALLVGHGTQIAAVLIGCLVIRAIVNKSIRRLVHHAGKMSESRAAQLLDGTGFGIGLGGDRTRQRAQAIGSVLCSLSTALILGIGGLILLSLVGIPITPIIASASVVGVALGLGARDLVTDFIAGIFMIFEDQYGVGDTIDAGSAKGTVEEVGLRITKLRDADGVVWYIRNGAITRIGNKSQGWTRAIVDVPVAYTEDVGRVREILAVTADSMYQDTDWHDRFHGEGGEPKVVGVETLDADGIVIRIQARTTAQKNIEVQRELRTRVKAALDEAGVQVVGVKAAS